MAVSAQPLPDDELAALRRSLGSKVQQLRKERQVNQDDFADQAGLSRAYIGRLENGRVDPHLSTLYKIAKALGTSVDELLRRTA